MEICCELQSVGTIAYWSAIARAGTVYLEKQERFQKSGYRNRYMVLGANGPLLLTLPVQGTRDVKMPVSDVVLDNSRPWQQQHWRTLVSCYNKSPYFSFISYRLQPLYEQRYELLWEWNEAMLGTIKQMLKLEVLFNYTTIYEPPLTGVWQDRRGIEKPSGRKAGKTPWLPYSQVFGASFEPNLSVFDLIFNEGNAAFGYLIRPIERD